MPRMFVAPCPRVVGHAHRDAWARRAFGRSSASRVYGMRAFAHPTNSLTKRINDERKSNVAENSPCPRRHQETAGLSRGGRRLTRAARWTLHRAPGPFQSAAAEGKNRASQT